MALTTGAQFGTNAFSVQVLETGVVVSLLAAGLLLILAKTNASIWPIVLVLFVAVMSGLAHGLEIAPGGAGLTFIAGFVASSATLLMTCLWIGFILAPIKIESSQLPTAE